MTEKILAILFVFIANLVAATGYAGITILMAIESACIPLPSELIMPFAGYLVFQGTMKLVWVATAGAIGCNLGSLVAYEIGCYGGRPLVERYGRWGAANSTGPIASSCAGEIWRSSLPACFPSFAPLLRCPPASPACRAANSTSTRLSDRGPGVSHWLGSA
jgi:membrane protein YqaA with SNARE-associated domain